MKKNTNFYIKTNRTFSPIRKYGWLFTLIVAIIGLWLPKLGLLVLGIMLALMISGFSSRWNTCFINDTAILVSVLSNGVNSKSNPPSW